MIGPNTKPVYKHLKTSVTLGNTFSNYYIQLSRGTKVRVIAKEKAGVLKVKYSDIDTDMRCGVSLEFYIEESVLE